MFEDAKKRLRLNYAAATLPLPMHGSEMFLSKINHERFSSWNFVNQLNYTIISIRKKRCKWAILLETRRIIWILINNYVFTFVGDFILPFMSLVSIRIIEFPASKIKSFCSNGPKKEQEPSLEMNLTICWQWDIGTTYWILDDLQS